MVLTEVQVEQIVRYEAIITELNDDLSKVELAEPELTPTLDQDIANINDEIASYADHPNLTRVEYIAIVQPLKTQRYNLILQNITIYEQNDALLLAARQQYDADCAVIQVDIDTNTADLIAYINTLEL